MERKLEDIIEYDKEWVMKFMKDTIKVTAYADSICITIRILETRINQKEDWDLKTDLEPLKTKAPETKFHKKIIDYIIESIDKICESGNPSDMLELLAMVSRIYHRLINIESMFDMKKLESLPEWQQQLP